MEQSWVVVRAPEDVNAILRVLEVTQPNGVRVLMLCPWLDEHTLELTLLERRIVGGILAKLDLGLLVFDAAHWDHAPIDNTEVPKR